MTEIERLGRRADLAPRRRFLPELEAEPHAACAGESVAVALRRITTEQFTVAIDVLSDPETEMGAAATTATDALDRVAALLRLVRTSIGDDTCAAELRVLRDAGGLLTRLTAGRSEVRSLDEIRARYDTALRPEALSDLRDQLLHRHQLLRLEVLPTVQREGSLDDCVRELRRARARFAAWPVDEPMLGHRPVPDSFDAFADGIERSYRRGRKRSRAAKLDADRWRRHVRDLGHQLELLSGAWPEAMAATVAIATDLAEVLGEQLRMRSLQQTAATDPGLWVDDTTAALVDSLCDHECRELREVAAVLATRLYAETPTDFVDRLGRYWATR